MKFRLLALFVVTVGSMAFLGINTPSQASAASLTTWQKFIKLKCSSGTPDAIEQCAQQLEDGLSEQCGAAEDTSVYKACWRDFITLKDGGSVLTPSSSPFEVEVAPEVDQNVPGKCAGVDTAIISCDADNSGDLKKNGVWALLLIGINILTAGIGIAAVGGVVYGSILYTSAGDNEAQVKQAKEVIRNVVIGVIAYIAMFALLQFIIPGGIFS